MAFEMLDDVIRLPDPDRYVRADPAILKMRVSVNCDRRNDCHPRDSAWRRALVGA
jgi:hypothetical protein